MGTTFANLNIHRLSINEAIKLIPGCLARQFDPEWITITSENFQCGAMDKVSKKISKMIDSPILTTEVFDDDLLILRVFRNGKNTAKHACGLDLGDIKKLSKPAAFIEELELPENYTEYLKWIFKCEDLGKKIQLLEKTLGIPLWIDYDMISDLYNKYESIHRDLDYVENYIKENKALEKIKNVTKAKELMELDGKIYQVLGHNKYLIHRPSSDENYHEFREHFVYALSSEGVLEPLFDLSAFNVDSFNQHIKASKTVVAMLENLPIYETNFTLFDLQGTLLGEIKLPKEDGYPLIVFEDGGIICSSQGKEQFIAEYGVDGQKKWELEVGYLNIEPIYHNGYIYLYYTNFNTNKSELLKINRNGEIVKNVDLKLCGGSHWKTLLFDSNGNFYVCLHVKDNESYYDKLFYIDSYLNIISELTIDASSVEGVLDSENNRLYISIFEKELLAVDIEKNLIYVRKKYEGFSRMGLTDKNGRLMMIKGMSTVEVFDPELNIISRHRLKGIIHDKYKNSNGNVCFITSQMPSDAFITDNVKSTLRVYEIV